MRDEKKELRRRQKGLKVEFETMLKDQKAREAKLAEHEVRNIYCIRVYLPLPRQTAIYIYIVYIYIYIYTYIYTYISILKVDFQTMLKDQKRREAKLAEHEVIISI